MNEHTKSAIILAIILLTGTGLFFWWAGFFEKEEPKTSEDFMECVDILEFDAGYSRDWAEIYCYDLIN